MFIKQVLLVLLLAASSVAWGQSKNVKFLEVAQHSKYRAGVYTLVDGTRHAASLRIWQDLTHNVLQVEQGKAEPINLQAKDLRSFVINRDSFAVVRGVAMAGQPATFPFGEVAFFKVKLAGSVDVLEHDQLVQGQTQVGAMYGSTMTSTTGHAFTWVLRPSGATSSVAVPQSQQDFAQHMAALFIDNPLLCQRIRASLVGPNDFKRIVYAYLFKKEIEQVTYEEAAAIFRQ